MTPSSIAFPAFDQPVPSSGYAWWYVDALSADGRFGLTVIAFIGSVFSPYYAWARRRGPADPRAHCALNVALYGRGGRWAMTERGAQALTTTADSLAIGPSRLAWDGQRLVIDCNEWSAPLPRRLRGRITVTPTLRASHDYALDADQAHIWSPIAPRADVTVAMDNPGLSWSGGGYLDHNRGDVPLENSFTTWQWARSVAPAPASVLYDVQRCDGTAQTLALQFSADGSAQAFEAPDSRTLAQTGWRVARATRGDTNDVRVIETLEDTPFYARSVIETDLLGQRTRSVHESLSLPRFSHPVVQCMLPFRMPRRARWIAG